MKYVNKIPLRIKCLSLYILNSYTIFLLIFGLLGATSVQAYTIGVIVGFIDTKTSTSDHEKTCILRNVARTISKQNPDVEFVFSVNDRSAVGSVKAAQKLIDKQVNLVLLPLISHEAEAAAQVLSDANIPFVTTATSLSVLKPEFLGLSTMPSNREQAMALANHYVNQFRHKKIHVITNAAQRYSTSIAKLFIQDVIQQAPDTQIEEHTFSQPDINQITRSIHDGDVIFASLFNPNIAILYSALAANPSRHVTILGPDSIGGREEFFSIIGHSNNNITMHFLKEWDQRIKGPNQDDLTLYVKTFCDSKRHTFLTTYSYDLIHLILDKLPLLKHSKSPEETISILRHSSYITAMDGKQMVFSKYGYNQKNLYLYEIKDDKSQLLKVLNDDLR